METTALALVNGGGRTTPTPSTGERSHGDAKLICYASVTRTRRNLDALRAAGWHLLLTPANRNPMGFLYAIDNGAYSCWTTGKPFDSGAFRELVALRAHGADWIVVPDVVEYAMRTIALFGPWYDELRELYAGRLLLALQDGMNAEMVERCLDSRENVGLFLGGSTKFKLATMGEWGELARAKGWYYHVARVNSGRRIQAAQLAGADSIDGSSATRYCVTLPALVAAQNQRCMVL